MNRVRGLLAVALLLVGCTRDEKLENSTFYSRKIGPVLKETCSISPTRSGCHVADGNGNAFGNLDLETYDSLVLRRDLLVDYGPYGVPGLLLKVVPPYRIGVSHWELESTELITTDVAHAAQTQIDFTSSTYTTLANWIANGAQENNATPAEPEPELFPCTPRIGKDPAFDGSVEPGGSDYAAFRVAGPVLARRCAAGNCHGSMANTLHLTCGETEEQVRWNYFVASDYVSEDTTSSEILRRALARDAGGTYHEGGTVFRSRDEADYLVLEEWVRAKMRPTNVPTDAEFPFFTTRVQPMLVKRGCMMLGCHSSSMFHDFRLRGGSGGHFGLPATRTNYRLSLEQLALESPSVHASRLVRKNLAPEAGGIRHRGGPLFGVGDLEEPCDLRAAEEGPLDEQSPFCVIAAWFARERAARLGAAPPFSSIVYVRRTPAQGPDTPQDYATYQPGSELVQATVTVGADGTLGAGGETVLSTSCGLSAASADVRRAAVSWDGARIAFSARSSATEPFRVYVVQGGACAVDAAIDAPPEDESGSPILLNGELSHNFDPTFAPDGRIVFTSTRGNVMNVSTIGYSGPQRAPADPTKLNANLYVRESDGRIRQLTFLLNQELLPSFMRDGRLIFTNEKRAPDFYQLAGRRMNLDGGDYHPLFGQRSTIDYNQLTGVVELADKNLAMILSDKGAWHGAGALAIVNRSLGVDATSTDPADYLVDQSLIGRPPTEFFQESLTILDPAATGKLDSTRGAYRDPSPLPDGRLLVAYAPNVTSLGSFVGKFEIVAVDPVTGVRAPLVTDGTRDLVWPVAVYAKASLGIFESRLDEANGASEVGTGATAAVTILDLGVLQSLMFQNTRGSGRPVGRSNSLNVWEELPPEPGVTDFPSGGQYVSDDAFGQLYVRRQRLGSVRVESDDSAAMTVPGGVPILFETEVELAGDGSPTRHHQRESTQFYPGERVRQGFRRELFNGLCAGCHGSISGAEMDGAVKPDVLTKASDVAARTAIPTDLTSRSGVPAGPPFP
ncbi:MAG TPA: hypothetical protein VFZ53_14480 [Polyangiaceae bacterium]